uniref:MOT41m n=1 Tax=Volvox carteri f. nagariensis TaxID=3068 RepID=D9CJ84_VOLCA|nr:MOT41m [Volvox carteri f. nagariensis]
MDDDGRRAAPKAGRRAARNANSWGDESTSPPEVHKGGFGLDVGFGEGLSTAHPSQQGGCNDEDASRPGPIPPPPSDEDACVPSRGRTVEVSGERLSGQRTNAPSKPAPTELLGEDSKKFVGLSRRKQEQLARGDDDVSRKNLKYEALTAGFDGIMDIPELEDEGREDLSNVVAAAPKIRTNKVQGMEELEEDMHFKLPAMDDRDIDLSLLTGVLCSSDQVQELDEPWDPDIVLTEVASAINTEREKAEGGDGASGEETSFGKEDIVK